MPRNYAPLEPEQIGAAIRAFRSEQCPACKTKKEDLMKAFCPECLTKLPADITEMLSSRTTYIEAFQPAMELLTRTSVKV